MVLIFFEPLKLLYTFKNFATKASIEIKKHTCNVATKQQTNHRFDFLTSITHSPYFEWKSVDTRKKIQNVYRLLMF